MLDGVVRTLKIGLVVGSREVEGYQVSRMGGQVQRRRRNGSCLCSLTSVLTLALAERAIAGKTYWAAFRHDQQILKTPEKAHLLMAI